MRITGIGINGDANHLNGSLSQLEEDMAFFHHCGFDSVELSVHGLDVVINGRLQQRQVDRVHAITERFDFVYTVHAPNRLNLAFPQSWPGHPPELAHEQDVFVACLDFCAAIGAGVMVYHSGLIALQQAAFGLAALPDDEALERAREQEVSVLRELMPLAAERGVVVAMENRDPHLWEVAILMRASLPPDQLLKYHAGMAIPNLVRQVEAVDHSNLVSPSILRISFWLPITAASITWKPSSRPHHTSATCMATTILAGWAVCSTACRSAFPMGMATCICLPAGA